MPEKDRPSEEELRFLQEMGMVEVEPGRWVSGGQGSDPETQAMFDGLDGAAKEQLDLMMRAGRVQNEFTLEQSGGISAASTSVIDDGPPKEAPFPKHGEVALAVFVAIKDSSARDFDALDGESIEEALDAVFAKFEVLPPPDAIAIALRQLGVRSRAIHINPHTAGADEGPDPRDNPGYRPALIHFPGAKRFWLD